MEARSTSECGASLCTALHCELIEGLQSPVVARTQSATLGADMLAIAAMTEAEREAFVLRVDSKSGRLASQATRPGAERDLEFAIEHFPTWLGPYKHAKLMLARLT